MRPNDVKEVLDALIIELELPLRASNSGPQLVNNGTWNTMKQSRVQKVVDQWMNGCGKSHSIYTGQTASNIEKAITILASETYRVPEIKEILKSLVAEQSLPLTVVDNGFRLKVLANEGVAYRCDDMVELEGILEKEGLDVSLLHNGFGLWREENSAEIPFSQYKALANRLAAALEGHGLQVRLLHTGFELQKNEADEVDIAEAKELTYRLEIMVGIRYVQGNYRYANNVENPDIHWYSAGVNTALPIL
ncbi:hypothetical protein F4Y93_12355 [Candidatus Poribacteria bacterium]|nr:hypothetical protein [Candidatus Poribacteria bacterium]